MELCEAILTNVFAVSNNPFEDILSLHKVAITSFRFSNILHDINFLSVSYMLMTVFFVMKAILFLPLSLHG